MFANLVTCLLLLTLSLCSVRANLILRSPRVTNWGDWGGMERCPTGTYAIGFSLKNEPGQGDGDDTALNGIKLLCGLPGEPSVSGTVESAVGPWGGWDQEFRCEGVLTGFQLRSEGSIGRGDDTAANNLRMFCAGPTGWIEGDGNGWGGYSNEQRCFARQAICGIQTQVEPHQGRGDDTALNNVNMECCDVPNPGSLCRATDAWSLVIECDNTRSSSVMQCSYTKRVGVNLSRSSSRGQSRSSTTMATIGFSAGIQIEALSANFESSLSTSETTGHSWTAEHGETWSEETTLTVVFEVPAGNKERLYQVVGSCGSFTVYSSQFRKVDVVE